MAGQVADGLVLAEGTGPSAVRAAMKQASADKGFHVAVLARLCVARDRTTAHREMAPFLAGLLSVSSPRLSALPFFDDLTGLYAARGIDALTTLPDDWWTELEPIGTLDDARAFLEALARRVSAASSWFRHLTSQPLGRNSMMSPHFCGEPG